MHARKGTLENIRASSHISEDLVLLHRSGINRSFGGLPGKVAPDQSVPGVGARRYPESCGDSIISVQTRQL